MTRMNRRLFVAIFTLCSRVLSQEQPTYMLRVERGQESSTGSQVDLITLRCRNTVSGNFELIRGGVRFWFNRATPDDPNIKNQPNVFTTGDGRGIVFQLPRQREGNYTCGVRIDEANVMESERKTLIALQTTFGNLLFTAMTTYFVASGGTVVMHCPVEPGSLYNYYYGRWMRNGTTIIEIPRPSPNGIPGEIMRAPSHENVNIDRRTFALTITSVDRERDASSAYTCLLSNVNPANGNPQEFSQAALIQISLMVNEEPTVIQGPKPVTVGLQKVETDPPVFTCSVGGAPRPSLIWSYIPRLNIGEALQTDTVELLLSNGTDYNIASTETVATNGLFLINSTVVFLSTANTDGGTVRCKTGTAATSAFADALLTVLGTADDINVIVSRKNDVIYELVFPVELLNPVTLNITYTNGEGETQSRIPQVGYNNTGTITYREVDEPPYEVYHVSIALIGVNGSRRIMGPPTIREEVIDLRMKLDPLIIVAIVFGSAFVLSVAIMIVVIVLCYKYKVRGQNFASINETLETLKGSKLPEEEVKKTMNNLNKAHLKLMFPKIRVEFDADEDLDKEPVVIFTQFLRDSFVEGFESDDKFIKDEFIVVFNKIKDKVPQTEEDDTARSSAGDEAIVNQTSRPEAHPSPRGENSIDAAIPCVTTQV